MQIIDCPDGSLVIAPVTADQVSALATAMGVERADHAPSFDGRFTLTVPAPLAGKARAAVKVVGAAK